MDHALLQINNRYWNFDEVVAHPVVKKMISRFRKEQQNLVAESFYKVHKRHYLAWESVERKSQHSLNNIKRIEWNNKEQCFRVYYRKTKHFSETWYHYTLSGEFY